MKFEIIDKIESFQKLKSCWNSLLQETGIASPFLTWEWMYTWWECYGADRPDFRLKIILGKEGNHIQAIFPAYIKKQRMLGFKVSVLCFLGTDFESSDYLEFITPSSKAPDTATTVLEFVTRELSGEVDLCFFTNVLEDRTFVDSVSHFAVQNRLMHVQNHHRICPYIPIEGDFQSYIKTRGKRFQRNLRYYTRKLFNDFHGQFSWITDFEKLPQAIRNLFILHEKRFLQKGEQSIFRADTREAFHQKVSRRFLEAGILRLCQLSVENEPIAVIYGFEFGNEFFAFQTGMDPAWGKYSPLVVTYGKVLEEVFRNRLRRFDLMRGTHEYKFRWTDRVRNMVTIYLALTPRGHRALRAHEWGVHLKDRVKKWMPTSGWQYLRSLVMHS